MVLLIVTATIHWLSVLGQVSATDPLSQQVLARVANPLLTSAQFLIPAAVAISGIHKMMEHRESSLALRSLIHGREHRHGADSVGVSRRGRIEQQVFQQTERSRDVEAVNPGPNIDDGPPGDRGDVQQRRYQQLARLSPVRPIVVATTAPLLQ